jgi:hypothetical protein
MGPPAERIRDEPDLEDARKWPGVRFYALSGRPSAGDFRFEDVTRAAGIESTHQVANVIEEELRPMLAGVSAGDLDGDGFVDLFVTGGAGEDHFLRNLSGAGFERALAAELGVTPLVGDAQYGRASGAPLLADLNADGHLDLFIGGASYLTDDMTYGRTFWGSAQGRFEIAPERAGPPSDSAVASAAAADYDLDGDLDVVTTHWLDEPGTRLWQNTRGSFADGMIYSGLMQGARSLRGSLAANFVDLGNDAYPELLVAVDLHDSAAFANDTGKLSLLEGNVLDDDSGMGATVADFDGDLDMDWFVSAILHEGECRSCDFEGRGNRLYRNDGAGDLTDVSLEAGVRDGGWGWAACAADLDLDGDVDLLHTNGMTFYAARGAELAAQFADDALRLFLNDGTGKFERADARLGLVDLDQGRGLVCFDYDRDGDIDVFVHNHDQPARLWRNDLSTGHALSVALSGEGANTQAIGARLWLRVGDAWQVRDIRAGTNYASQDPAEAHFGLGDATRVDELWIRWPTRDPKLTKLTDLPADHLIVVDLSAAETSADVSPPPVR